MADHPGLFNDNIWTKGSGLPFQSANPADGSLLWQGNGCTEPDVNQAVKSAQKAFDAWSALSVDERSLYLDQFKKTLTNKRHELAELISQENGKPLWDADHEVQSVLNKISTSLEAYGQRCAGIIHNLANAKSITRHRPHGVVGILGPFNFPAHIPSGHIIPALLAGNTLVFKPSELTPLVGEFITNCWRDSGLPSGVFNLIQGGKETGQALIHHDAIQGIFFTGSYPTGRLISEHYGKYPEKILALELGGNNPLIIHEIEDLTAAAYMTIQSAFLSAGQRCTCARRLILIENKKTQAFTDTLVEMAKNLKVGTYKDHPEPFMGPVISEKQALELLHIQEQLKGMGGKPLLEMQHLQPGTGFVSPGLIEVDGIAGLPDEEYFGPFLQIIHVKNLDEAIKIGNRTKYGLTAGIFTSKEEDFRFFYHRLQAGIINWNMPTTGAVGTAPFGGIKCSGNNRPSAYYAADYCAYPVASMEASELKLPVQLTPGITF